MEFGVCVSEVVLGVEKEERDEGRVALYSDSFTNTNTAEVLFLPSFFSFSPPVGKLKLRQEPVSPKLLFIKDLFPLVPVEVSVSTCTS